MEKEKTFSTKEGSVWDLNVKADRVILFLHGYMSKKESFYYQTKYLSGFYRIIAPDMPGFGCAEELTSDWGVSEYAEWVENLLKSLNIEKVDILAHSFGARVAIKLYNRGNIKIGKMLFTGGAGMKPKRSLKYYYRIYKYKYYKKRGKNTDKFGSEEYRSLSPVMKKSYVKIVNEHLEKEAEKIDCPVLLVYGSSDSATPLYMAKRMRRLIKNSQLYIMQNADHFCFCKRPEEFNVLAYSFFKEK